MTLLAICQIEQWTILLQSRAVSAGIYSLLKEALIPSVDEVTVQTVPSRIPLSKDEWLISIGVPSLAEVIHGEGNLVKDSN